MRSFTLMGLAAAFGTNVLAACQQSLKIDDFSKWSSNTNSLGEWTSDDGSMTSISASNKVLSLKPKSSDSYFYESFQCQTSTDAGYAGIAFTIKGPSKGSVVIELQTKASCSAGSYSSYYYQVTGLSGSSQTVTLPYTNWAGANGNAVAGIVWSGWSSTSTTWQLSNIEFVCSSQIPGSSPVPSVAPSSAAPSSVKASSSAAQSSSAAPASSKPASSSAPASSKAASSSAAQSSSAPASSKPASSSAAQSSSAAPASSKPASSSAPASSKAASSSAAQSSSAAPASSKPASSSAPASSKPASSSAAPASSKASSSVAPSSKASSSAAPSSKPASSSVAPSSSKVSSVSATLVTVASVGPSASGTCSPLLIDDWISQSRLTFLFYNAFNYPTSDDGTMTSLTVGKPKTNRLTIVPKSGGDGNYFYSQLPCVNAKNKYGGISLRIKAPKGTTFSIELDSSDSCDPGAAKAETHSTAELNWSFDGSEQLYLIPFDKYPTLNTEKLVTLLFAGFSQTVEFGPMALYCGKTGEYIPPPTENPGDSTATVPAPANPSATNYVVDKFASPDSNALGFWHGGDEGMTLAYSGGQLKITSNDADYSFYTQISSSCSDFSKYKGSYLHIKYSGTPKFTVALQQHNQGCNADVAPYPETWDSAEAERYAKNGDIYIPMSHFKVDFSRVIGFALKGFYTTQSVTLSVIEISPSVPSGWSVPPKDATGDLVFACKRPNSFAFAIDDGVPDLAQEVLKIIREENIKVTFFTVGAPLLDASTNLTNVYKEMQAAGHQLAYHSQTHPKMEGLPDYASIDWEYNEDVKTMKSQFNGYTTHYFRPPFGTEGARMRSRLVKAVGEQATITNWSVDVEDWLWAQSSTPEQQKVAFQRDVNKGGNLVVLHYLYPSTVSYLREFIQIAKKTGKQLMRVDQCMMDPNAPPL